MPNPDDLERIYKQVEKEYESQLTPEQKEDAEKAKKKLEEVKQQLAEQVNPALAGLPTAKDFFETRFRKDMAIYRLGLRADEMNILTKLEDIRQAVVEENLEYANMALQFLIIGLKK